MALDLQYYTQRDKVMYNVAKETLLKGGPEFKNDKIFFPKSRLKIKE